MGSAPCCLESTTRGHVQVIGGCHIIDTIAKGTRVFLQMSTSQLCRFFGDTLTKSTGLLRLCQIRKDALGWVLGSPGSLEEHGLVITDLPLLSHGIHVFTQISDSITSQHAAMEITQETNDFTKVLQSGIPDLDTDNILENAHGNLGVIRENDVEAVCVLARRARGVDDGVSSNGRNNDRVLSPEIGFFCFCTGIDQCPVHSIKGVFTPGRDLQGIVAKTDSRSFNEAVFVSLCSTDMNIQVSLALESGDMNELQITICIGQDSSNKQTK
ncbi:expressed unknown protein [Seminavis robusta]|uniref:Uncharacterized protein n=1 Tax=Seminavis robusta TaxID=568900 RepID=A0A9N8DGT5_9STRA|nr:expressed unknown protein [Seminavis robusta]|eukprot:Sro112_g055792.1  (270) ;mRNA; r:85558-86367